VSASESASSAVMDGAGVVGDSIGTTITQSITTTATTPIAGPSITVTPIIAEEAITAEASTGPVGVIAGEAPTGQVAAPGLSTETIRLPEDTRNLTARAVSTQMVSVATTTADKPEASLHVEIPASAAGVDFTAVVAVRTVAAVAVIANTLNHQNFVRFPVDREIQKWRKVICGERS